MGAIWPVVLLVLVSQVSPRDIHVDINQIVESGPASVNVEINQDIVNAQADGDGDGDDDGDDDGDIGKALLSKKEDDGDIWAVLVAGSTGWDNYRHQSDICHAYQILRRNGIPEDHIIVMMYDDIANNFLNPTPGTIINSPSGPNVYDGVPKDYTGSDVTIENFRKVLLGVTAALKDVGSGKVVKSGPNNRIFINFDGHGAPGLFGFPNEMLMADDFAEAVEELHQYNYFKEMMVYMESCYSGSMFQDLFPNDIGFYALSASSPYESSYATYCSGPLDTCLGDLFSVNWMENVERNEPTTQTLKENFDRTRELTNLSAVMPWGQISIADEFVSAFMGSGLEKSSPVKKVKKFSTEELTASSVNCQDVPLFILQNRVKAAKDMEEAAHWNQKIVDLNKRRSFVNSTMNGIAMAVAGDEKLVEELMEEKQNKITNWDCYGDAVDAFHTNCFNLGQSTYALTGVPTLLNLCEAGYDTNAIVNATKNTCTFPTMYNVV